MDNSNTRLLEDTKYLLEQYNKNPSFRSVVDRLIEKAKDNHVSLKRITYRNRPLKVYTDLIIDSNLQRYKGYRIKVKSSPEEVQNLFREYYQRDFLTLKQMSSLPPSEDLSEMTRIEQIQDKDERNKEYKKLLTNREQKEEQQYSFETPTEKSLGEQEAAALLIGEGNMPLVPQEEDLIIEDFPLNEVAPQTTKAPQFPKIPPALRNYGSKVGKDLASKAAILLRRTSTRFPTATWTLISGTVGAALGYAQGGTLQSAEIGAVITGSVPTIVQSRLGRGALGRAGNTALQMSRMPAVRGTAARMAANVGARAVLMTPVGWVILAVIGVMFLFLFIGLLTSSSILMNKYTGKPSSLPFSSGGGCPDTSNNKDPLTCQYLNPSVNIFGDLTTEQIALYISNYWKQSDLTEAEFTRRANLIATKARQVGLNPVIFLGYWKSESWFGDGMGCIYAPKDFDSQVDCAVGLTSGGSRVVQCAAPKSPYHDQGCQDLKSIIMSHLDIYDSALFRFDYTTNHYNPVKEPAPVSTLDAIAEGYGPRSQKLEGNGVTNYNCSHTYNILVDMVKELRACQSNTLNTIADASCPVPNGKITCGSYGPAEPWGGFYGSCSVDSSGNGGHCNAIYQNQVGICTTRTQNGQLIRTAKSIDITGKNQAGEPVYLPDINGQKLTWYYKGALNAGSGFGYMRLFQSEKTSEGVWSIHFVHVNADNPPLAIDQQLHSGDLAATMYDLGAGQIHVHVTVGLNVGDSVSNLQDYSSNWLSADRDLKMCTGN